MNTTSIPQIYVTVPTVSPLQSSAINKKNQKSPINSTASIHNARDNIRERLNLHVKRRIQEQETSPPALAMPVSPISANLLMQKHEKMEKYPNSCIDPNSSVAVFGNSLHKIASGLNNNPSLNTGVSMLSNDNMMSMAPSHSAINDIKKAKIEKKPIAKLNSLSNKSKKYLNNKKQKAANKVSQSIHTVENFLLNGNSSSSIDAHKAEMLGRGRQSSIVDQLADTDSSPLNGDCSRDSFDKQENSKVSNTPDILSMVLSIKKNALMHDPDVIRFISSIR